VDKATKRKPLVQRVGNFQKYASHYNINTNSNNSAYKGIL
jgi:hypothetical protein